MAKKVSKKTKAVEKKKGAAPKPGRLVEVEAKLPLTDKAKVERGELACQKMVECDGLILERKTVANEYKARVDALTSEATKLLLEFREGREIRTVKAHEIKNFERNTVEYLYKDVVIHQRPMTLADRQDELPIKEKNAPLPRVSALADDDKDVRPPALKGEMEPELCHTMGNVTSLKSKKISAKLKKHDPVAEAHAVDSDAEREELAKSIQEDTSKRSAWSSVDS